jgi:hypothetical protein
MGERFVKVLRVPRAEVRRKRPRSAGQYASACGGLAARSRRHGAAQMDEQLTGGPRHLAHAGGFVTGYPGGPFGGGPMGGAYPMGVDALGGGYGYAPAAGLYGAYLGQVHDLRRAAAPAAPRGIVVHVALPG